jgi:hypothetical protein
VPFTPPERDTPKSGSASKAADFPGFGAGSGATGAGAARRFFGRCRVDLGGLGKLLLLDLGVFDRSGGVGFLDFDRADAHGKRAVHDEAQNDEAGPTRHGYFFSTLIANFVMPSTFARSMTPTTLP